MDMSTGKIYESIDFADAEVRLCAIDAKSMTEKQKESMQVSKHDNRSELGKICTEYRQTTERARKNQAKRDRRKRKGK